MPSTYGLPGDLTSEELHAVLNWLIQGMKLTHAEIDVKVS